MTIAFSQRLLGEKKHTLVKGELVQPLYALGFSRVRNSDGDEQLAYERMRVLHLPRHL